MRYFHHQLVFLSLMIVMCSQGVPPTRLYLGYLPSNRNGYSNDLIVGARVPGDRLLCQHSVIKSSSFFMPVSLERTFNVSKYERITQLRALDQKKNKNGKGASARLLRGGPGLSFATLHFKNQRGHGIDFLVEIYARPC